MAFNMIQHWQKKHALQKQLDQKLKQVTDQFFAEAAGREKLLSSASDWSMLETLIQQCNSNPNLKVDVNLKDGTVLHLRCYNAPEKRDYMQIDGKDYSSDEKLVIK